MASTRTDVIQEALLRAEEIQDRTVELAKAQLYEIFSHNVEDSISKVLGEAVTVGKDQPAGYDQDADQDALAFGSIKHKGAGKEDINKGGKGPQKLEASVGFDEMDEADSELEAIPISEEEELDEASDEDMDESEDMEAVDESADEDVDEAYESDNDGVDNNSANVGLNETKALKATVNKLTKELKEYKKAFGILKTKFDEVNLLNAKVNESTKYLRYPGLTMKQKESIVEAFDRARSIREVGLVSKTLAEGIRTASAKRTVPTNVVKPVSSKRVDESYSVEANRLQELAGLK